MQQFVSRRGSGAAVDQGAVPPYSLCSGSFSVEVILALLSFKVLYPEHMHLTRGNHETKNMNKVRGSRAISQGCWAGAQGPHAQVQRLCAPAHALDLHAAATKPRT